MNIKTKITLLSLFCSPSCFALSLADAPIQQVTLYPTAAKIERSIPVKAGERIVTLEGLAANFDANQMQFQTSNIDVNAVSHSDSAVDKPSGNESSKLKTQIEQLEKEISVQNAIIQSAELQNKYLGNLTSGSSSSKVRQDAYDAFVAIDKAKIIKEKLLKKSEELQQDLDNIGDNDFNQRSLKFYVQAPSNGQIKLSYMVPYARWQPTYKAELDSQTKQIKLTRMAMIAQKTGEDWNNVNLVLSTSSPQGYVRQVSPAKWWVDYEEPQPQRSTQDRYVVEMAPAPAPLAQSQKMSRSGANGPSFPDFQATDLNFSSEFRANAQTSIPSSQQQIYLPLGTETFNSQLSIWAIPRQSNTATVNAEIPKLDGNWPSGMIKLYRDGDYIGQRTLQNTTAENLQMSFGQDELIQIQVIDLTDKRSATSSSKTETVQKQQYIIQNMHPYPVQLTLFDSQPESRNDKLVVQTQYSRQPNATTWQDQPNINSWNISLGAKQKFELTVDRHFKYPSKGSTSGF
ncbi:DUF4139 domain-containing protein [Acinetobacter gerneri]|uniref:DUF4139 domain-containing protein n=1 Tax=Acinetobacter gerneri DSM 14967 = CIP 107464 = MTCC 9824 TaxID=1120926 RepID=N8YCJ9_9GAMM|nr:DUF4139 domain-containing protein [Acinetobacter gerneri]ENV34487.1 hypothetical protein F960_01225 [Acinetobacter gerneri DSM 14967 = CIP 107464 = MTCC 9824]EPR80700.1 hypothetical protein L289_0319 [Acinetobacter gerneri DSM 14967 = CIP 107464 = MTCC 9824]